MEMPTSSVSVSLSEISAQRTQLLVELSALTEGDGLGDLLCGKKNTFFTNQTCKLDGTGESLPSSSRSPGCRDTLKSVWLAGRLWWLLG